MSSFVEQQESRHESERLAAKPLDEAQWQSWIVKGREDDLSVRDSGLRTVKWLAIGRCLRYRRCGPTLRHMKLCSEPLLFCVQRQ